MAGQPSSAEAAAALVRRMILAGELRPGDRVPQDAIATRLGISRIPVREALIALEREGWLTIEIHRGAYINVLDEASVVDHYALYALVYGWAAQRALERDGVALASHLRSLAAELRRARGAGDIGRLTVAFNAAVIDAAGSSRARVALRSMTGLLGSDFFHLVPEAVGVARSGCAAVARAVEAGDGEAAAEAYATMMWGLGQEIVAVFRSRGLLDGPADHGAGGSRRDDRISYRDGTSAG